MPPRRPDMVRTQILFQEDQYQFLKARSRETGTSISALVRDIVERLRRSEPPRRQQAIQLLGAFEADHDDVSIRHDEYLTGLMPDAG